MNRSKKRLLSTTLALLMLLSVLPVMVADSESFDEFDVETVIDVSETEELDVVADENIVEKEEQNDIPEAFEDEIEAAVIDIAPLMLYGTVETVVGPQHYTVSWTEKLGDIRYINTTIGTLYGDFTKRPILSDTVRSWVSRIKEGHYAECMVSSGGTTTWSGGPFNLANVFSPTTSLGNNSATFYGYIWI